MGKITSALQKAAEERMTRIDKKSKARTKKDLIVRKISESTIDPKVVVFHDPKALVSEQYKILRTNILSLNKNNPPHVFVVTSSIHSEGKTITSLNLAFSLAQAVRKPKILLIDADMRKGKVSKYLGVTQEVGLSEILNDKCLIEDAMFSLDYENLTFISSGAVPENPSELLSSERMHVFIADVKDRFDHVIFDTPPIISVTDSGILGAQTDGVLLVIQAGRTQRGIISRAEELLYQSHCNVFGHVLTNIEYHLPEYIYRYL